MFDGGELFASSAASFSADCFSGSLSSLSSKKRKMKNKRRFSDEQIKSLETMFESETKLEPRKKLQVARELGLQPRQIAIWFQNKRARRKSKQLERDYSLLMTNYNNLASQYESLKKEKQSLVMQLQQLKDLIQKSQKDVQCCRQEIGATGYNHRTENRDNSKNQMDVKPSLCFDLTENGVGVVSDDDSSTKSDYFGLDEDPELINNIIEPADGTLTSPETWDGLENECLVDQPKSGSDWWDFWS